MNKSMQRKHVKEPTRLQDMCTDVGGELAKLIGTLSYREKLSLAQRLIQLAQKEEEERNPNLGQVAKFNANPDSERIQYVADRLKKLKPSTKNATLNSIGAMFQFQGGISEEDKECLFAELRKQRHIVLAKNGRIHYPEI